MIELDTLRIAIAMASTSLVVALMIGWLHAKQEGFLMHGAAGTCAFLIALLFMGFQGHSFVPEQKPVPYTLILIGLGCVYSATRRFRNENSKIHFPIALAIGSVFLTLTPLALGLTGVTAFMLNTCCGVILLLCAYESWAARKEIPIPLTANAALYALTALSYLFCSYYLVVDQAWVIDQLPDNWAETFNSVMALVAITSIGTITLTLHYARSSALHLDQANTDSLTGVLNRRALFARFPEDKNFNNLGVIMLDLDHFKQINDHFGHARGDQVLTEFASILREHLRPADIIARLGGEEFCVVLLNQDKETAALVAERIRRAYASRLIPIDHEGNHSTLSAGLAIVVNDESFSSALHRADVALYDAKRSGRNQVQVASLRLVA